MTNDPEDAFRTLHRETTATVGGRLFTIMALDRRNGLAWRAYTSHPVQYPVTGTKPIQEDAWFTRVVVEGKTFVANALSEFAPLFPDHALIQSLGCEAVANVPVPDGSAVVGVVNVLDRAGHFTPDRVQALEVLVQGHRGALVRAIAAPRRQT